MRRRFVVPSLGAAVGLAAWMAAPAARAADPYVPGDVAKRGRLFFDADMAYWQGHINDPRSSAHPLIGTDAAGVLGYRRVPLGFGVAYAFSEHVVVGGRVDVAFEPHQDVGIDHFTMRGGVGPFVEILIARERYVRPFLLLRAGLGRSTTFVRESVVDDPDLQPEATLYPTVGAGLGTHVFLSREVSFDAMITLDHRWNFARPLSQPDATVDGDVVRSEGWTIQDGTIGTALTFGFSHWW